MQDPASPQPPADDGQPVASKNAAWPA